MNQSLTLAITAVALTAIGYTTAAFVAAALGGLFFVAAAVAFGMDYLGVDQWIAISLKRTDDQKAANAAREAAREEARVRDGVAAGLALAVQTLTDAGWTLTPPAQELN